MAWFFGKKKKEEKKEVRGVLPELNLPDFEETDFPVYESVTSEPENIKRAVGGSKFAKPNISRMIMETAPSKEGGKPLFVKIEKYKEAIAKLHLIKTKLDEAEAVLMKVEELKAQEDMKLKEWKQDIELIKERLLEIDQTLYE